MGYEGALVLVVDDTPISGAVISLLLSQIGWQPVTVTSGQEALEVVLTQPIALVLMDCQMPGMDGFEATARIRQALPPGRHLPIIALTGQAEDRERGRAAGMDDHLMKPLQISILRATLARWLGGGLLPVEQPILAPAEAAPLLDPVPLTAFERMKPGSRAVLLGLYDRDLAAAEASLASAIADGDLTTVARATHKIKGSSLTVGARALAAALADLGRLAKLGSLPACQEHWGVVQTLLAQTRSVITASAATSSAATPPQAGPPWPSARARPEVLATQRERILRAEGLLVCLDAMPGPAMLLNSERQILVANQPLLRNLDIADTTTLVGQRPGEVLDCHHAHKAAGGCGSAAACAFCGAVQAIVACQQGQVRTVTEARLTIGPDTGHALDVEVTATPIRLDEHSFVLVALRDIAGEKRRQVLERHFFHDVLNSAGGVHGLATQLALGEVAPADEGEMRQLLAQTSQQLIEEIQFQNALSKAESGELQVNLEPEDLAALLRGIRDAYACHPVAARRALVLGPLAKTTVRTDRVLFRRAFGNLVKNALEATPPGGVVTIGSRTEAGSIWCTVHNPGVMPLAVQHQIFQRSFSTKGEGRGLGTWSAKLLGERYLGGRITFTASESSGTELVFALPL